VYLAWEGYKRYKKFGVVFNDAKGFSVFRDLIEIEKVVASKPTEFPWLDYTKSFCGGEVPPVIGLVFLG
jgi:hypothetical protein